MAEAPPWRYARTTVLLLSLLFPCTNSRSRASAAHGSSAASAVGFDARDDLPGTDAEPDAAEEATEEAEEGTEAVLLVCEPYMERMGLTSS